MTKLSTCSRILHASLIYSSGVFPPTRAARQGSRPSLLRRVEGSWTRSLILETRRLPCMLHLWKTLDHHAIGFQPSGLRLTLDVDLRWPAWTVSWRPSRCEGVQLVPRAGLNDFRDGKTEPYAPQVQSFPTTWPPPVSPNALLVTQAFVW